MHKDDAELSRDCIFSPTKNVPPRVFDVPLSTLYARSGGAVPQVIVDIISKLDKSRLRADMVFKGDPNQKLVTMFKGLYDGHHNQPLNRCFEIYTVAGLLKELLKGLPKPIISDELARKFVNVGRLVKGIEEEEKVLLLQSLVTQISTCERRTLKYILFYLNRSCKQKSLCLTNASRRAIAKTFVPILFKKIVVEDLAEFTEDSEASAAEHVIDLMIKKCQKVFSPFSSCAGNQNRMRLSNGADHGKRQSVGKPGTETGEKLRQHEKEHGAKAMSAEKVNQAIDFNISLCVSSLFPTPAAPQTQMERSKTPFPTIDVESIEEKNQKSTQDDRKMGGREKSSGALKEFSLNIMEHQKNQGDLFLAKEQKMAKPRVRADDFVDMATLERLDDMSYEELLKEKKKIKRKIRMADNQLAKELGRKPTQLDKEPLRPMYSWYFRIKRLLQNNKVSREQSSIIELLKY